MRFLMLPGDLACNATGLPEDSDHRIILRMFVNTLAWGILLVGAALAIMV